MAEHNSKWDTIPSIEGLEVDWDYEPDSALGRRRKVRIENEAIRSLLGDKTLYVKVVAADFEEKGMLIDLSIGGVAVMLPKSLGKEQPVRLGFFLGKDKILANGVIKNSSQSSTGCRVGIEFDKLEMAYENIITGVISSHALREV